MRFDRFPRWTHRTLLAMTVGFVMVAACGPVAPDPQPEDVIQVDITAVGPGTVRHPSSGFVCRGDCIWAGSAEQATGFVAEADGANAFVAWTGVRHTLDATCAHLLEDGDATTATFAPHALRLHRTGDGEGEFRIQQGTTIDIGCTEDCAVGLPQPLSLAITYFAHGCHETVLDEWDGAGAGAVCVDTFSYVASDGELASAPATVTITVTAVNDAPVAVDDAYGTAFETELVVDAPGVLDNDADPDGDTLTVTLGTDVANGTLDLQPDGSFTYTPDAAFSGNDTFTYTASDGVLTSAATTVTITVATEE
jgi:hypothetical protein